MCATVTDHRQRGASLITAVFLITALAALGALMGKLTMFGSRGTVQEYFSAQALYAAESGLHWGSHYIATTLYPATTCPTAASPSEHGPYSVGDESWFQVSIQCYSVDNLYLYIVQSRGTAGGSSGAPRASRQLEVQFSP